MKKHLVIATLALASLCSYAQSSKSKVSAPMTATPDTLFSNMVQNTSLSLLTGIERYNDEQDQLGSYLHVAINKKFSELISVNLQVRSGIADITKTQENQYELYDPRIIVNAFNTEVKIVDQEVILQPQLRVQPHTTSAAEQGDIATIRLGATATTALGNSNTFSVSAFYYDELTDNSASSSINAQSSLYTVVANQFAINDSNGMAVAYEHQNAIDQTRNMFRSNGETINDLRLTYTNMSIKNLWLGPYINQHLEETLSINETTIGFDAQYTF